MSFDAEKAFDKLWRPGLFYKLLKDFGSSITMLIKVYYDQSYGLVKNDKYVSELFKIKTGVKQGGVISGHLYNFNMNDYYVQAELKNLGAKLNDVFIGCVGYCDDNINISSIISELQLMIDFYVEYCSNWGIKINDEKCCLVSLGYYNDINAKLLINNKEIKKKSEFEFLGYLFKYNLDDNSAFYNNFNSVRSSFFSLSTFGLNPNGLNPFLQAYIYKTFCLSKFLYGIEIMSLNKATVTKININKNFMIKSML